MRYDRQFWRWIGVLLGTLTVLTGCTYDAAVQRLSLAEQSEFHTYSKVMTPSQVRTYLAKATAAERTAYLSQVGLAQRFQGLDPTDRDIVLGPGRQVGEAGPRRILRNSMSKFGELLALGSLVPADRTYPLLVGFQALQLA